MNRHGFAVGLCLLALCVSATAQTGPDVIVGDLHQLGNYGDVGAYDAFAVGTTSCNVGDAPLNWVSSTQDHPVIAQNMFRLHNGAFEQIGLSWLKHGFTALTGSLCDPCGGPGGSILSPGCSDPYSSGLNGQQGNLGPRWEVNATTGFFPYPYTESPSGATGDDVYKRVKVLKTDLDPALNPGALYFVDGHYIANDDSTAGNDDNNASWRPITITPSGSGYSGALAGATVRTEPAIFAWKANDPTVELAFVDVPGDGRFWVGFKSTPIGGGVTHYEYAVQNLNSDRSGGSFTIPMPPGASVTNIGFKDVEYHSGEPWDNVDWTSSFAGGNIVWQVAGGSNNALRWSTLYNFRFDSDMIPGDPILGLFAAGSPGSVTIDIGPPEFSFNFPSGTPNLVVEAMTTPVNFDVVDGTSTHDAATVDCLAQINGGGYASVPVANNGGGSYTATLPAGLSGDVIDFYFTADETGGGVTRTSPDLAPGNFFSANVIPAPVTITPGTTHIDNFESGPGAWAANNAVWEHGAPTASTINAAASGSNVFATNLAGNYSDGQLGHIEANFDCTTLTNDPIFSMEMWFETEATWDGVSVQMDSGSGFQTVGAFGDPNWFNDDDVDGIADQTDGWTGSSGGYATYSNILAGAAGNVVSLRVLFGSDGSVSGFNGAAVDDITIFAPAPTNGQPSTPGFGTLDVNNAGINGQTMGVPSGDNGPYSVNLSVGNQMNIQIGGEATGNPSILFVGKTLEGGVPIPGFGVVDLDPMDVTLPIAIVANGLANPPSLIDLLMSTNGAGEILIGGTATSLLVPLSPFGLSAINVTPGNNGGITVTNTLTVNVAP